jgi:nucleoside recognition membrane protein YjiH
MEGFRLSFEQVLRQSFVASSFLAKIPPLADAQIQQLSQTDELNHWH